MVVRRGRFRFRLYRFRFCIVVRFASGVGGREVSVWFGLVRFGSFRLVVFF